LNDLFPLDDELSSEEMFADFESEWNRMSNVSSYRLGRTIVLCLRKLFFAPVIPNLLLMPLIFAQPFLVTALLNYISSSDSKELGYLIVAGHAADFILKAICTAFYTHQLDRFVTMLRGCLVNIIYNQTLKLEMKEAAGGESLTLMSADVEHIVKGFGQLHEASSNGVMTIVALGLLYRQLGLSWVPALLHPTQNCLTVQIPGSSHLFRSIIVS
jgi:ATP-binding cassette subfamily C (CFTR/MRP) protein 1